MVDNFTTIITCRVVAQKLSKSIHDVKTDRDSNRNDQLKLENFAFKNPLILIKHKT